MPTGKSGATARLGPTPDRGFRPPEKHPRPQAALCTRQTPTLPLHKGRWWALNLVVLRPWPACSGARAHCSALLPCDPVWPLLCQAPG